MKFTKIAISILLVTTLAVPAMASSDWVEDFLRRYDPSKSVATVATTSTEAIGQLLPTGTSLTVDASMNRASSTSNLNTFNPSYIGTMTYTVGQHLLRDRGRLPNTRQIIMGKNTEKISETAFEIQLTNLLVQAQKSYWDLVFAGQDLDVKRRSLELAQQTLDENKIPIGLLRLHEKIRKLDFECRF